jgi:hypothetical protein
VFLLLSSVSWFLENLDFPSLSFSGFKLAFKGNIFIPLPGYGLKSQRRLSMSDTPITDASLSRSASQTESKQHWQIAVTCVFLALSIPAVVLRIWVRKFMINSLGVDDWFMVIALVSSRQRQRLRTGDI